MVVKNAEDCLKEFKEGEGRGIFRDFRGLSPLDTGCKARR